MCVEVYLNVISPPTPPHPTPTLHDVFVQVQEERAVAEHDVCVCVQVQEERAVA